jgi:hypothetical protein
MDAKVRICLDKIEEAQGLINEAASGLSSVDGFSEEWSKLGKLYDSIKDHWHLIEGRERDLRNSPNETPEP